MGHFTKLIYSSPLVQNEETKMFSSNSFKVAFQHISHLLASGIYGMVFDNFRDLFHPKDSANVFL